MSCRNAIPVLRLSDVPRAKVFHMDMLGFEVFNETGDTVTGFGIFRAGAATLFFRARDRLKVANNGWQRYCHVDCLLALIKHFLAGICAQKGLEYGFFNIRNIEVTGPAGNVLYFGTDITTGESALQ